MRNQITCALWIKYQVRQDVWAELRPHTVRDVTEDIWNNLYRRAYRPVTIQVWSQIDSKIWTHA
jgi:hypothetical protein